MPYYADTVADYFIKKSMEEGTPLTPLKLLKLVYIAHGWHLALLNKSLINEVAEAWKYGPVIPQLYHRFKKYGSNPITEAPKPIQLEEMESDSIALLDRVWSAYKRYNGLQLSSLTHNEGTPWDVVNKKFSGNPSQGQVIPDEEIRKHYRKLADERTR